MSRTFWDSHRIGRKFPDSQDDQDNVDEGESTTSEDIDDGNSRPHVAIMKAAISPMRVDMIFYGIRKRKSRQMTSSVIGLDALSLSSLSGTLRRHQKYHDSTGEFQ